MYLIAAIFALDAECLVEVSPTPTPTVSSALWAWVSCLWEVEKKNLVLHLLLFRSREYVLLQLAQKMTYSYGLCVSDGGWNK